MADAVVGKMTEKVMDMLFKFIGRHIAYLVGYKRYVKNLEDEAKRLEDVKQRIEGMVGEARRNVEIIDGSVEGWLEEVLQEQQQVAELLEGKERVRCLSMGLRYRLGRRGCKKKEDVIALKQRGDGFVERGSVGHPAPLTYIWYTHATEYERFGSRVSAFNDIMKALGNENGSYVIGIHGLPGVGKTRMADEVAKQAKADGIFHEVARATVSQAPDFEKIQQELAGCLDLPLDKDAARGTRAGKLCQRLKSGNKILVVLDDVWEQINLMEIGIPNNKEGCKILLTSRRQDVCIQMRADKILLGVVDEDEAWSLLKTKVGESVESAEMRSVAKKVCKECGGLPLAILAVGGALMDKGKPEWNDALRQLGNSTGNLIDGIEEEVYNPIKLSYQYLEQTDAQSCFLHCSLFAEDAEISVDDLVWYGVGTRFLGSFYKIEEARDRVHVLVGTLKRSSLLLQGRDKNFVKMHDVIRDVAISIASRDEQYAFLVKNSVQGWPANDKYECCIAISSRFKSTQELPDELECPKLRTLVLASTQVTYTDPQLKVPINFFKWMEKLEVLDLRGLDIWTMTSSLQNLVNLRVLRLIDCSLVTLSLFNELHTLKILCLRDCIVEESPSASTNFAELATEVGKLLCLQILDFKRMIGLNVLPKGFISNLSCLEELYIYEFDGWKVEGNVSPLELNSLTCLSTLKIHIPDLMLLPKDLPFESLNRFKISIGYRFRYYEYDRSVSRALKLYGIPLTVKFNTLIERAQALSFIEINGLEKALHGRDFSSLEYLTLDKCECTEHLLGQAKQNSQTSFVSLGKLRVLNVSSCRMKYLFSVIKDLPQLQELYVKNCERLEGIIGERDTEKATDRICFNGLKKLTLENLPKLKSFCANMKQPSSTECNTSAGSRTLPLFNAKVLFPALEELEITRLDNMTAICEEHLVQMGMEASQAELCPFGKLRVLNVSGNCKLKYLFCPSVATLFDQLQRLHVNDCESLETIIEEDEERVMDRIIFHQLKELKLAYLPILKSFFANTREMSSHSTNASPLFDAKAWFPSLETLVINGLDLITVMWDEHLLSIPTETSLDQVCSFKKLSDLTVYRNCKLKYLFSLSIATCLRQLRKLKVKHCGSMEAIIGDDEDEVTDNIAFYELKSLKLENLPNMKSIYANMKRMSSTEGSLSTTATTFFNTKVWFPSLKRLAMDGLDLITVICDEQLLSIPTEISLDQMCSFKKLSGLKVSRNCKLKYLFSLSIAKCLGQLQELKVEHCGNMEAIIGDDEDEVTNNITFYELKSLKLENLPKMKSIYANVKKMSSIEGNLSTTAIAFFNTKVSFPVLKELGIYGLKCIMTVNRLCSVKNELRDSFPQLEALEVRNCENMEMIVAVEMEAGGGEAKENDILVHPQLKKMRLEDLPNLKSFWGNCASKNQETVEEALFKFNCNVKISHFEELYIKGVDNLKEIWHITVPSDSVSKLRKLTVRDCANLLNVGPLKLLGSAVQSLQKLVIMKCPSLQDVFKMEPSNASIKDERVEKDEGLRTDKESSAAFCQLKKLCLPSFDSLPPFARGKESFPVLDRMEVSDGSMFEDIMEGHIPEGSLVGKVRVLTLQECRQIVNVGWVLLLQRFEAVKGLNLTSCSSLQVLFNLQRLDDDATERLAMASSRIKELSLKDLPKLEHIWMMGCYPKGPVVFSNLVNLSIECCNKLRYLFSFSTARALMKLTWLHIWDCEGLEEIVVIEDGEENIVDEIMFPQLDWLSLANLTKLTSFCGAKNIAFNFPDLTHVGIRGCPKLYTFTCGATRVQRIRVFSDVDGLPENSLDINDYVQQYARKMGILTANSNLHSEAAIAEN